jgi:hypothetical protein
MNAVNGLRGGLSALAEITELLRERHRIKPGERDDFHMASPPFLYKRSPVQQPYGKPAALFFTIALAKIAIKR